MGLGLAGVPHKQGGVDAAMDYLAGGKNRTQPERVAKAHAA